VVSCDADDEEVVVARGDCGESCNVYCGGGDVGLGGRAVGGVVAVTGAAGAAAPALVAVAVGLTADAETDGDEVESALEDSEDWFTDA
jgi:hypothetical protein